MTLAAVEALVRDRIGLDPVALGSAALPRAVANRTRARGLDPSDRYSLLLTSDPDEWAALLAELVVPETWFFRGGRALFDHLAGWVRQRSLRGTVRILSAPCSTGEEPFSLVLALDALGVAPAAYQIDAVDLSADHLRRATAAVYPAFSFREPGPDPRVQSFQSAAEGRWELLPRFRESVRFRPANLIDPDFLAAEPPYDLILCRNLFIYLTDEGRAKAIAHIDRLLTADGRLCITPAEADRLPSARFVPDGPAALSLFRKTVSGDPTPPRSGVLHIPRRHEPSEPPRSTIIPIRDRTPPPISEPAKVATRPADAVADPIAEALALADAGKLDEARIICERAAARTPTAAVFSLLGVVQLSLGYPDAATEAFRKALYLDANHAEALSYMAVLSDQRDQPAEAAGFRRRLARTRPGGTA